MSRRANPKVVGAFAVSGIALLVAAALVFGSFTFFQTTRRFVVFFQGSVDGLSQGSAVVFRGVPIGRVVEVGIRYDPTRRSFDIPVIIEIQPGVIARFSPSATTNIGLIQRLVDNGLRARLETASLVTGQQVIQLNFFPGTPIKLEKTDLPYPQLPTVPSSTQQIMSSVDVAARDLPTLITDADRLIGRMSAFLSPENEAAVHSLLASAATAMKTIDTDASALGPLIGAADNTVAGAGQLTKHLDGVVQDNREDIRTTLRNIRQATVTVDKLMDQLYQIAAYNRVPITQFSQSTLPDVSALVIDARTTVNKMTTVLDSLERNPMRFLFGNKSGQGVELK